MYKLIEIMTVIFVAVMILCCLSWRKLSFIVILFIANRVAPAFQFCLDNSTAAHASSIRWFYLCARFVLVRLKKRL